MPKSIAKPQAKPQPSKPAAETISNYGTLYYVQDMPRAVEFFKRKLGLKPRFESPEWTEFGLKGGALCLHDTQRGRGAPNGTLILRVPKVHEAVERLKAQGVKVLSGPKEVHPGAYSAEIEDLDGNVISFYDGPTDF